MHSYSCLFGTFLADSECEKMHTKLPQTTCSLWSYLLCDEIMPEMLNPKYEGKETSTGIDKGKPKTKKKRKKKKRSKKNLGTEGRQEKSGGEKEGAGNAESQKEGNGEGGNVQKDNEAGKGKEKGDKEKGAEKKTSPSAILWPNPKQVQLWMKVHFPFFEFPKL